MRLGTTVLMKFIKSLKTQMAKNTDFKLESVLASTVYNSDCTKPYEEKKTPWSESASELYRPSDRRLSAK
jgi:hypothetical protein